jgi:hypothetical protein
MYHEYGNVNSHAAKKGKKKLDRPGKKCHTNTVIEAALLSEVVGKPIENQIAVKG